MIRLLYFDFLMIFVFLTDSKVQYFNVNKCQIKHFKKKNLIGNVSLHKAFKFLSLQFMVFY